MSIRYWHPQDEDQVVGQPQSTFFGEDQNAEWWVGIQRCAASIAVAATLAITAGQVACADTVANSWQDDPALAATSDEYFWQNPTAPVAGKLGPLYLPDPEEIPAGKLTATVDEYFWINPTQPVAGYLLDPQQWTFDSGDLVTSVAAFQPDEDFWINPAPLFAARLLPFSQADVEEIPAGSLFGQPEEYYWQNPVFPALGSLYQALPLGVDDQTPILYGQFDEDFWVNPTAPSPGALLWPQQWTFDTQDPGNLFGQFDEDFWTAPVPVQQASYFPQQFAFDSGEFAQPVATAPANEDYWINYVTPVAGTMYLVLPYMPDMEDVPALFLPPPPPLEKIPGPYFIRRHGRAEGLYLPGKRWR